MRPSEKRHSAMQTVSWVSAAFLFTYPEYGVDGDPDSTGDGTYFGADSADSSAPTFDALASFLAENSDAVKSTYVPAASFEVRNASPARDQENTSEHPYTHTHASHPVPVPFDAVPVSDFLAPATSRAGFRNNTRIDSRQTPGRRRLYMPPRVVDCRPRVLLTSA